MGIIFFGAKNRPIDVDEFMVKCPSCESQSMADLLVSSKYYHIYWIPIFPFDKEVDVFCQKCGLRRTGMAFDNKLISNFEEVKHRFRHKWYLYAGLIAIAAIILLAVIMP